MFNLTVKAQSFGEGGAYERPIDQQQLLQDLRFLLRASVVHLYGKNLSYKQKTKGFAKESEQLQMVESEIAKIVAWARSRKTTPFIDRETSLPIMAELLEAIDKKLNSKEFLDQLKHKDILRFWADAVHRSEFMEIYFENRELYDEVIKKNAHKFKDLGQKRVGIPITKVSKEEALVEGGLDYPTFSMLKMPRTYAVAFLGAAGIVEALPLIEANLLEEESPLAIMGSIYASMQLGSTLYVEQTLSLVESLPLSYWSINGTNEALPILVDYYPYHDFTAQTFAEDFFTVSLLALAQTKLNQSQKLRLKNVVLENLALFVGPKEKLKVSGVDQYIATPLMSRMPKQLDSTGAYSVLEILFKVIDIMDIQEAYEDLQALLMGLGREKSAIDDGDLIIVNEYFLTTAMLRLNKQKTFELANLKLKELNDHLNYTLKQEDNLFEKNVKENRYQRSKFKDQGVVDAFKDIAPELIDRLEVVDDAYLEVYRQMQRDHLKNELRSRGMADPDEEAPFLECDNSLSPGKASYIENILKSWKKKW
ncbi:MAG: hypothetical protein KDD58_07145 [Bdellovibrionales bacterium]|nr:hypothetical protein [Bdellovibrionales bacterium]